MVVLIALVEAGLAARGRHFTTVWAAAWQRVGSVARREAQSREILFFGDSLVMQGVAPRAVTSQSGFSAYNFAVFKGLAPANYFLLKRCLQAGARPRAVFIDGELLPDDPAELVRLWPELLTPVEAIEFALIARDRETVCSILVSQALASFKQRHEIRDAVTSALLQSQTSAALIRPTHLHNWSRNDGANILPSDPRPPLNVALQLESSHYWPNEWSPHPVNHRFIERFLALCEKWETPVYWLLPPVHPEVQRRRDLAGLSGHYERFLQALQRSHPSLRILDSRHTGFPESALADLTHLNREGAAAYSYSLGKALREELAQAGSPTTTSRLSDRWIKLEPFLANPANQGDLVDLDQSTEFLRNASTNLSNPRR
jgi:hypothetical protein